ncbi:hypothetical protein [Rhodopseudomonas palustris]|uniref:hypothetical protein n=1 Tax=Rhodopseudomonas palustris TaxID=1076 RepID=UPI001F394CC1|nr:hypothetical protein [Rhodopseudomonas palustris]
MDPISPGTKPPLKRTSIGVWVMVLALLVLLGLAGFFAYQGLVIGDVEIPAQGYVAMAIGIALSLVIGIGLMVLVFYSSRRGYDEQPSFLGEPPDNDAPTYDPPDQPRR